MAQVLIAKTHVVDVDTEALTPAVREYIFNYGLKQVLNDAGSAGKSPDEKLGMAQKKLDALLRGEVARAREAVDEIGAEARRIARKRIGDALRAKGQKLKDVEAKAMDDAVAKLAQRADIMEAAREAVEARRGAVVGISDDILEGLL